MAVQTAPEAARVRRPITPAPPPQRERPRFEWWQPGWPLTYLLTGYPLWWLLGLTQIFLFLAVFLMAVELLRSRSVAVRAGFGWWLLFLAWVAIGVTVLQINAPSAEAGASNGRYLTFTYRFLLYLAATVVLLYIYNTRSRLTTKRIVRAFAWLFVTVVGGGVLGATVPFLNFPSAMELVLPHGVTHIDFVRGLLHPGVAQVVDPEHPSGNPRTSAPFTYTNEWGLAFGCLLPFFLVAWCGRDAGWRRTAAPWILLLAVYPVVQSRNRGLWVTLVLVGLIILVRVMVFGRIKVAILAVTGAALAGAILLSTPLGATITGRLSTPGSETGRANLGTTTLTSVADKSPVIGFGTTRHVQGSFYSIAGGDSAFCRGCSPPPFGTQGQFWLVVFTTGYVGLALYLGFLMIQLLRYIRLKSPIGTLGIVVIIAQLSTMLVYSSLGIQLVILFATIGLLWRETADRPDPRSGVVRADPTLGGYADLLRRGWGVVAVCAVIGAGAGLVHREIAGISHESVTAVAVPVDPNSTIAGGTGLTVDTLAQLIGAPAVERAVEDVTGTALRPGSHLFVTARTSSRVLEVHVIDDHPGVAARASRAAGDALIATRAADLVDQRSDDLRSLKRQRAGYGAAIDQIDALPARAPTVKPLTGQRARLISSVETVDANILKRETARIDPGRVLGTVATRSAADDELVAAIGGFMLGALIAVVILFMRHTYGRRFRPGTRHYGDLPVLARMPLAESGESRAARAVDRTADALRPVGPVTVLSADDSELGRSAAAALDDVLERRAAATGIRRADYAPVVLLAANRTTDRQLDHVRHSVQACGTPVAGVVAVDVGETRTYGKLTDRLPWHQSKRPIGKQS